MYKIDYESNEYVAAQLPLIFTAITRAIAGHEEDFRVGDIEFSAITKAGLTRYDLENKRIMGGFQLKYDGEWNPYFTTEIYSKLRFRETITTGTPIYFVNATDAYGNDSNGKWQKLLRENACLCFLAPDGLLLFSPKTLREAFLGFADYYVKHTTNFKNKKMKWEKKAVLDLTKGTYIPLNPPIELFEK